MSTDKEDMVNGSSSTSRVSSNFVLARTAPLVHSTPRLTECNRFLQLGQNDAPGTCAAELPGVRDVLRVSHTIGDGISPRAWSRCICK